MKSLVKNSVLAALASSLTIGAALAQAHEEGDILMRGRVIYVNPMDDSDSIIIAATGQDSGTTVEVGAGTTLDLDFSYMFTDNFALELLLDLSSKHTVNTSDTGVLGGLGDVIEVNTLPPSLFAQYHFAPKATVQPYVGLGLNYTMFLNEKGIGALAGADVELDSSFGLGAQAGADIDLGNNWFANVDMKYIDIDTQASINSALRADVSIDPVIFGVGIGTRF